MDPELYDALKGKIQLLDNTATRLTIPEGRSPTTMKNRILRVAGESHRSTATPHPYGYRASALLYPLLLPTRDRAKGPAR